MPEIWALTGDSSDNIAGIKGIGPAKARKLIEEYGDLDALLEEYDKFTEEEVERVRTNYRLIKLSGELATYSNFPLSSCEFLPGEIDIDALNDFFDKYGFKKFKAQLKEGELL
jgi:DNA polymerase I, thermostable